MFTPEGKELVTNYTPPAAPRKPKTKTRITKNTHPVTLDFDKKFDYDMLCTAAAFVAVAFLWIIVLLY